MELGTDGRKRSLLRDGVGRGEKDQIHRKLRAGSYF